MAGLDERVGDVDAGGQPGRPDEPCRLGGRRAETAADVQCRMPRLEVCGGEDELVDGLEPGVEAVGMVEPPRREVIGPVGGGRGRDGTAPPAAVDGRYAV